MSTENLDLNILLSVRLRSITRLSTLKIIRYWSLIPWLFHLQVHSHLERQCWDFDSNIFKTYSRITLHIHALSTMVIVYEELTCTYAIRFCGTALNHSVEETGHFVFRPKPINFVFPSMNKTHCSAHSIILCKADYNEH